jgi:hypothetical protein
MAAAVLMVLCGYEPRTVGNAHLTDEANRIRTTENLRVTAPGRSCVDRGVRDPQPRGTGANVILGRRGKA